MKRIISLVIITLLALSALYYTALGADNQAVTVDVTVNAKKELTMPSAVNFGTVDPEVESSQSLAITVKSNQLWNLQLTESADLLGADDAGNFQYRVDGGSYSDFAASQNLFGVSQARGVTAVSVDYRLNVPYTTPDGIYSATHTYTII